MNDELQKAVTQLITRSLDGIDTGVGFLSAEIPLYIQELLMWKGVFYFIQFITSILVLGISLWVATKYKKWCQNDILYSEEVWAAASIQAIVTIIPFVALMNFTWLQIWLAPRVYLVEYAASLAK